MKKLTINWIRHGVSCGNIRNLSNYFNFNIYSKIDPSLFPESITTTMYIKKHIPKSVSSNKLILCSQLSRAIETAILMFPEHFKKKKIKIIFNVNELGLGISQVKQKNNKLKISLRKFIKSIIKNEDFNSFYKFKLSDVDKIEDLFVHIESNNNINNYKNVYQEILELCSNYKVDNINIVSHSHFIKNKILFRNDVEFLKKEKYIDDKNSYLNYFRNKSKKLQLQIL
tara:strand:- start:2165 stop:2845 length:681 start_codon:yes stop_codon:yes gene_type:complete